MRSITNARICILFCFLFSGYFSNAQKDLVDSLKSVVTQTPNDTIKVRALNELGWQLLNVKNDYRTSLDYFNTALHLSQRIKYKKGYALSLNLIGLVNAEKGNYAEALKNYLLFLKISEESGFKKYAAYAFGNMGRLFYQLNNFPEALKNEQAALKLFRELNNKQGIANCLEEIGTGFYKQKKYSEAILNFNEGLGIFRELHDSVGIAAIFADIGAVKFAQGELDEALINFNHAMEIRKNNGEKNSIAKSEIDIAQVYLKQNLPGKAENYLANALKLSTATGSKGTIRDAFRSFVTLDSMKHNYQSAFNHYKSYIIYKDSLYSEEITRKTLQAQMQSDFNRKQETDSLRNAERTARETLKHNDEIRQQKTVAYSGVAGFILMIIVAAVSYRAYKTKQKDNAIIVKQKKLVDEKQKEIIDSIKYANRIQISMLPTEKYIDRILRKNKGQS